MLGCASVFLSAFFFYLATVMIKWSQSAGLKIDPAFFVFSRFTLGFIWVSALLLIQKKRIQIRKKSYLLGRTITNCIAVYCFFKAVELTSVAQANILNMTYPLFITLFSWIFLKYQRNITQVIIVTVALIGIWLILNPRSMNFNIHSLWGLASGISAAASIMYLNLSRRVHDTETTLFFLFGLGSVIIFVVFFDKISLPQPAELKFLLYCSVLSIAGQYLITLGFKYVSAIEGGIISSTRILLAAVLGPFVAMDPALSLSGWIGACLIFGANVYLTWKSATRKPGIVST